MQSIIESFYKNSLYSCYSDSHIKTWLDYIESKALTQNAYYNVKSAHNKISRKAPHDIITNNSHYQLSSLLDDSTILSKLFLPSFESSIPLDSYIHGFFSHLAIFGLQQDYILIEIYQPNIDSNTLGIYAINYAFSAFMLGYQNIVIAFTNTHFKKQDTYQAWQESYRKILQSSNIAKYQCLFSISLYAYNSQFYCNTQSQNSYLDKSHNTSSHQIFNKDQEVISTNNHHIEGMLHSIATMLYARQIDIKNKSCLITGCDTISTMLIQRLQALRAKPITLSDKYGFIYDKKGLDMALIKESQDSLIFAPLQYESWLEIYAHKRKCDFITQKEEIWNISAFAYFLFDDSLMPSLQDSTKILKNGCKCMVENLSLHFNSIKLFLDSRICYIPAILLQSIIIHSLHAEYNTTTCNVLHKDIESLLNAITHHANEARFPIDIYLGIFLHCYTNLSYYISNNLQF